MAYEEPEAPAPAPAPCPWCGSVRLVDFGGEMVCPECGAVMAADRVVRERERTDRRF
jgi:uncharacterized Zn finger protein (UPF0148 family)